MNLSPRQRTVLVDDRDPRTPRAGLHLHLLRVFRWREFVSAIIHPVTLALLADSVAVVIVFAWYPALRPMGRWGRKTLVALSLLRRLAVSFPRTVLLNAKSGLPAPAPA
ncbi:MAG TPA: hypothetical protein VHL58_17275 [Thermoanaerobaculia bacterium]|nr:hypothetical protein [Thermoanaerobaculia bacterium]